MRLHDYLDHRAEVDPYGELGVMAGSESLTCAEGARHVACLASGLADHGLEVGTRVAYLSTNSLQYGLFYFGASKAGVVPVPLNYRLVPREWSYIIEDAGCEVVFAQAAFADGIDSIRDGLGGVRHFVCVDEDRDGWESIADFVESPPMSVRTAAERACEDAYQMYTSGTTGRPKGVVLSQQALLCTLVQWRLALPIEAGARALVVSPIYHASGALTTIHAVASGASTYVMSEFDAAEATRVLSEERIGFAMFVPAMISQILEHIDDGQAPDFPQLRTIFYGASAIAESTLSRAIEVFGCAFVQAFGMTEMPNLVYLTERDHERALSGRPDLLQAAGRPGPGSAVKIVDEHDNEVPPHTVGEICGRGGQVMSRYWQLPDATAEALRGGWMHTGDAGYVDDEGYLFIKDRIKDMISSGAENVYPREVEDVLMEHPDLVEAAVIGIPSERWGESVHAVVVVRDGHEASEAELLEFCVGRIAGFKRPRSISFVSELPRNASGKVLKRQLRDRAWKGRDRAIG